MALAVVPVFALPVLVAALRRPVAALPGMAVLLGGVGLAVGLARFALGVHFPFDIVGAGAIGTAAALLGDGVLG